MGPAPRLPWAQLVAGACQATCALGPQPRTGQVTFQEKAGGLQGSQLLAWARQVCPSLPPSLPPPPRVFIPSDPGLPHLWEGDSGE